MKKVFLLVAAAIVCMSANAQFQIGGKVGFDMTNFWGEKVDHGMKPSYQFGLVMENKFNPHFAIAPEVVFASQGGKVNSVEVDLFDLTVTGKKKLTYNTNYINIPLMLKYYVAPAFSIDFGPQVGFNVYSKATVDDETFDLKDGTKTVDFGLGLGGTYNLTDNAFVQARYTLGMTKVFDGDLNKEKNGNVQIAFGMKF